MSEVNSTDLNRCIKEKEQAFSPAKSQADAEARKSALKNLCILQLSEPAQCEGSMQDRIKCATDPNNRRQAEDHARARANAVSEVLKSMKR